MSDAPPRALVLDDHLRQALAVARALGRSGAYVGTAGYLKQTLAGSSRYVRVRHRLPGPGTSASSFSGALDELVAGHGYQVVFASDDGTIEQLRARPPAIPCVPDVRGDGLDPLVNKVRLGELASELGITYPRTRRIPDEAALDRAIGALALPLVVKAESSASIEDDRALVRKGATIARSADEARQTAGRMKQLGVAAIAQEFVARVDTINATVFRRAGSSELRFPYRVLREVPLTGGTAVAIETIAVDSADGEHAASLLERVCDGAGYEGVANGEFCKLSDGRLVLIEVNARPWGSLWFAERHGHRVSERCMRLALGQPGLPPPLRAAPRRFHHISGEINWVLLHPRRVEPLREVVRTTRPWDVFEYVELRDPKPLWTLTTSVVSRRLRRRSPSGRLDAYAAYRIGD